MRMTNYVRDRQKRRVRTPLFLLVLAVLLFAFWRFGGTAFSFIARGALFSLRPLWGVSATLEEGSFIHTFFTKERLFKENSQLLRDHSALTELRAENARLKKETDELRKAQSDDVEFIARIIARPPQSLYDTLVLDIRGSTVVRPGMLAVTLDNTLLGTVRTVRGSTATVLLFSSSGVQTEGAVGASSTPLAFSGRGGGALRTLAPQVLGIAPGDVVNSPRYDGRVLAIIEKVNQKQGTLESVIDARVPYALSELKFVALYNEETGLE